MDVDRVLNPIGARIRLAGSSFIVRRNTSAAPASSPDRKRGSVIDCSACVGVFPRLLAASSILGLICRSETRIAPTEAGRNNITYANISSTRV